MKKIITLLVLSILTVAGYPQLSLKVNDKLIYDVDYEGNKYNFTIKIKSLKPVFDFVWQMTNENNSYGEVKVSEAAMATAMKMNNYFAGGNLNLTNATTVLLSKAAYKQIQSTKRVTLSDGGKFEFANADETTFSYKENGQEKSAQAIYLADAKGNDITVLKNPEYPLILRMNLGWTIQLNTIVSANNAVTDLSIFVNKTLIQSRYLWDRLDRSSEIKVEDYSSIGDDGDKKQSVYKEYFNHMEGLWIKTHNDTINEIIYYPLPMTHSYHTYYGGTIKIPQLTSYNFNRAQAKTFVKVPFQKKSSYDTDIYKASPGSTMELYYHTPIKTAKGVEFGITGAKTPLMKQQLGFITFQQ